jgi:hypothetical protein
LLLGVAAVGVDPVEQFMDLHAGMPLAFGTGKGEWVKRSPTKADFVRHLTGEGSGIGIAPLRPDNTVMFAAIDLDEPDFDAAFEMQDYIPGTSFVERSRSGNAHVLVYFAAPCPAWVAMGVLKEATLAAGKQHVEVFPKNHDFAKVKFGNYINLSYHGDERPVVTSRFEVTIEGVAGTTHVLEPLRLEKFLHEALTSRNDPAEWERKARWLLITPPEQRESSTEFGQQANLHICAEYILEHAEDNPIREGHRAAVYFALSKQLSNCSQFDHDEALMLLRSVNDCSPDKVADSELRRILGNAERGQFTSFGCDDPLVVPYASPRCPIAFPRG